MTGDREPGGNRPIRLGNLKFFFALGTLFHMMNSIALGEKGLCSLVHKKNIKLFQPAAPDILVEKTKHLTALAHALIPSLRRLQKQEADVSIRTLVGREGYITNLQEVVESALLAAHAIPMPTRLLATGMMTM